MNTKQNAIEELHRKNAELIGQADAPIFRNYDELAAAITLVSSRLNDPKRPVFDNDRALLGRIMEWIDFSFTEVIPKPES